MNISLPSSIAREKKKKKKRKEKRKNIKAG